MSKRKHMGGPARQVRSRLDDVGLRHMTAVLWVLIKKRVSANIDQVQLSELIRLLLSYTESSFRRCWEWGARAGLLGGGCDGDGSRARCRDYDRFSNATVHGRVAMNMSDFMELSYLTCKACISTPTPLLRTPVNIIIHYERQLWNDKFNCY